MSRSRESTYKKAPKASPSLPVVNPHAAGIDVGSDSMYVSVPTDSSPTPVAKFGAFTPDLQALSSWLKECGVQSVAMESTGVYWIPLFEILEAQGFAVTLVSPNYPKKPHKTDVEDCQWLQYLHSVGLLRGSFRPPATVCAIRSILRHRGDLVTQATADLQRMQKSLIQMNLLLHNVISDISGTTGTAIIDAILAGERDPAVLSQHRDPRIKASAEEIEKSLIGNYRAEHLFTLRQSRQALKFHREQIQQCDAEIAQMLKAIDAVPPVHPLLASGSPGPKPRRNEINLPGADTRSEMLRMNGVDLTQIPGIGPSAACVIFSEIGSDLSRFPTLAEFCSWLRLCPDPNISGGQTLARRPRPAKSPLSCLLRQVTQSLHHSRTYLGDFYRRIKAKHGPAVAAKATAHKIARIIYAMLTTKTAYDETRFNEAQNRAAEKRVSRFLKEAQRLGYEVAAA